MFRQMRFGQEILPNHSKTDDMDKIKVVWICTMSNTIIRSNLKYDFIYLVISKLLCKKNADKAVWNTVGCELFANSEDVELHVVTVQRHLSEDIQDFENKGIFYHAIRAQEDDNIAKLVVNRIRQIEIPDPDYKVNRKRINNVINRINPDIVHLIGAENPYYSLSLLDISDKPTITTLQTVLFDPNVVRYYTNFKNYNYRTSVEKMVLSRSDYVATNNVYFKQLLITEIKDVKFIDLSLPTREKLVAKSEDTLYDFVYFSADLEKACDLALLSFGLACQQIPEMTLLIIGGCSDEFKRNLDSIVRKYHIERNVFFAGFQKTHADVISAVRRARFALLPLRTDLVPTTIRESMCNGLPVITTITPGTPSLNNNRESVLLSAIGDHKQMSDNILKLYQSLELQNELLQNGYKTAEERWSCKNFVGNWVEAYKKVYSDYYLSANDNIIESVVNN